MSSFSPGDLVRARGREWVVMPHPSDSLLRLRPLSGVESDATLLDPDLELMPVESARFDLPADATATVQSKALLLADALRLTLRRGAGPFRSAAKLSFEPRTYQLVPLLMALRLDVPRLLIADDVGIGKTIEAGLILREFIDRGEVDSFTVLCPPQLVDQWVGELKNRFGIDVVAVTSSSAATLERNIPISQSVFDAYPFTVVSLDYIKSEKRRENFAKSCPDFCVVDEAHTCVGTGAGRHQRYALLSGLARDAQRRLLLLTATPHSGDEVAFARLLELISPEFASLDFDDEKYRINLARHFVQRRRIDVTEGDWAETRTFPKHETTEAPYRLDAAHLEFHRSILDYCFGVVEKAGSGQRERRLAFWGTLALMRCVGSSPASALSALRHQATVEGEQLESGIFDDDGADEDAFDMEPGTSFGHDSETHQLILQAERLLTANDPKVTALLKLLKPLIREGSNPVIFCRFLATATYLRDHLRKAFPKLRIEAITGALAPDERRERVSSMLVDDKGEEVQRLLVATDCLSEGINLQQLFDTVIHYDLCWNPTRHQQREGRVDRFGQPSPLVRSIMLFSPDSAIDGAVLSVILRKAEDIRKATGITVPLPDERGAVTDALMASVRLHQHSTRQLEFDFSSEDSEKAVASYWRDTLENEKRSRARFAQNAMKPSEVAPEWERARQLLGSPEEAREFVAAAMRQFGTGLETRNNLLLAHLDALTPALRDRLSELELSGSIRLAVTEPAPVGTTLLIRSHPLVMALAESLTEASLDPDILPDLGIGRTGVWQTNAVNLVTRLALLRIRYKLTVHSRSERILLAEEAALVAIRGDEIVATGGEAHTLLATSAIADIAPSVRNRIIAETHAALPSLLSGVITHYARERGEALSQDHQRLRTATRTRDNAPVSRTTVVPVLPPDIIGLYTLIPPV